MGPLSAYLGLQIDRMERHVVIHPAYISGFAESRGTTGEPSINLISKRQDSATRRPCRPMNRKAKLNLVTLDGTHSTSRVSRNLLPRMQYAPIRRNYGCGHCETYFARLRIMLAG